MPVCAVFARKRSWLSYFREAGFSNRAFPGGKPEMSRHFLVRGVARGGEKTFMPSEL